VISTDAELLSWLPRVEAAGWIALDTEADSLHAYPEKLCLIQVSLPGEDRLLDSLAAMNLAPFFTRIRGRELILHGADYDLRLLHRTHGFVPAAVFDTMVAARMLGFSRFSLQDLAARLLGVTLEKASQKANWARRPLTARMEAYARSDTRYLKPIADSLEAALRAQGRLDWVRESCARLIGDCTRPQPAEPDTEWRAKGSHRLNRHGLAALRELWHWREHEAVAANRPPFFVLRHDLMVSIAEAASTGRSVEALLPRHFSERRRASVLHAVQKGVATPPERLPRLHRPVSRRPSSAERKRFHEFEKRRDATAKALGLDPSFIASRATLWSLTQDHGSPTDDLLNWQRQLLLG
jgi:ribonuclease D